MMRIKTFLSIFLLFVILFTMCCKKQSVKEVLIQSDRNPLIDGKISDSEYTIGIAAGKMNLYLSRNNEKLSFGLFGETMGWISIGFGAPGMDKAHIIMGYTTEKNVTIDEQIGRGHGHQLAGKQILTDSFIIEKEGYTTFEGAVRVNEVIIQGRSELNVIIACGVDDDFTSRHIFRKSIIVKLE